MTYPGKWHGKKRYFGMHYDLHAGKGDTELGLHATPEELIPLLKMAGMDFVQTDCKGHPGYTSWFSQTPEASVPPALKGMRSKAGAKPPAAGAAAALPLLRHLGHGRRRQASRNGRSSTPDGKRRSPPALGGTTGAPAGEKMCPRSPYLDELMIPQMMELIDRYEVDGFWMDGDLWAAEPCYCRRCRTAFTRGDGIAEPPTEPGDPNWAALVELHAREFRAVRHALLRRRPRHKPGVLVCSNWLQTFRQSRRADGAHRLDQRRQRLGLGAGRQPLRGAVHLHARQAVGHHAVGLLLLARHGRARFPPGR